MQHDILVMGCHLHQLQHHVMPMASSMGPLHLFSCNNENEVQHYFFGHVMHLLLTLVSCDPECHQYCTIILFRSMRCNMTLLSCDATGASICIMWQWQCHQGFYCIPWVKTIKMRCKMTFWWCVTISAGVGVMWWHHWYDMMPLLVVHDANWVVNGTLVFLRSRWSKLGTTWLFWSCNTIGTSVAIMWHWQYHQWHCCIP